MEVAEKTGMNADKLLRVLRFLTTQYVFTEVLEGRFRLTSLGRMYRSDSILYPIPQVLYLPIPTI